MTTSGGRFSVTFLGHQGWMFRTAHACILIDPLLHEDFGTAHALSYRVYPPRVLRPESFPKIDAVFLSHEHDDHFDIPSLSLLDRKIPIYLSARSSTAGYRILTEMGFQVRPLIPGLTVQINDLEVLPMAADHINTNSGDEWDTLPYLVREINGAGSFFSMVDCTLTAGHLENAKAEIERPGIVGWTNNSMDRSHMTDFLPDRGDTTEQFTLRMQAGNKMITDAWGAPRALLVCAGGFAFTGARAWLNHRFFCVDTQRVCEALSMVYPDQKFCATRPGQTFHMEENVIVAVDDETPFLGTAPLETWPARDKRPRGSEPTPDYEPATGSRDISRKELDRLQVCLREFAESLVGSTLFKSLYSLMDIELPDRVPSFALVLRTRDKRAALLFAYNPNACDFVPIQTANPRAVYLAGMECWATDFLAVLSGELGPIALSFGRSFMWNALPARFNFNIVGELYRMSHPLRRPNEFYRIYQRLLQKHGAPKPTFFAAP